MSQPRHSYFWATMTPRTASRIGASSGATFVASSIALTVDARHPHPWHFVAAMAIERCSRTIAMLDCVASATTCGIVSSLFSAIALAVPRTDGSSSRRTAATLLSASCVSQSDVQASGRTVRTRRGAHPGHSGPRRDHCTSPDPPVQRWRRRHIRLASLPSAPVARTPVAPTLRSGSGTPPGHARHQTDIPVARTRLHRRKSSAPCRR